MTGDLLRWGWGDETQVGAAGGGARRLGLEFPPCWCRLIFCRPKVSALRLAPKVVTPIPSARV
ncbi:MAG: hypothetical protein AUJ55_12095 [Proteobacteria bacterium CG1_02_64_396]|nr:MAG: hypothetical protein AUJ55_12095 [Proteobacteria bacterium CG1_02_64_396]